MYLSPSQISQFEDDGFLVLEDCFTEADLEPLIDALSKYINGRAAELFAAGRIDHLHSLEPFSRRYALLFEESKEIASGIYEMKMRGEAIFRFLHHECVLDCLEDLLGPELMCSPIQHFRAKVPARISGVRPESHQIVPWHQDAAVMAEESDGGPIITCWIPLVDATRERGCLQVLPGAHRQGYLEHRAVNASTVELVRLPDVEPVTVEVAKGSLVFLSQFTPHGSTPNWSEREVRWSLDLRYHVTGKPSPRPWLPSIVVRSRSEPSRVFKDCDQWLQHWEEALQSAEAKRTNPHPHPSRQR